MKKNWFPLFLGSFFFLYVLFVWIYPDANYHFLQLIRSERVAHLNAYGWGRWITTIGSLVMGTIIIWTGVTIDKRT